MHANFGRASRDLRNSTSQSTYNRTLRLSSTLNIMAGELTGLRDFFLLAILAAILVSGAAGQPAPIPAPFNAIDSEETTEPTGEWTLTDTLCYVVSSFIAASLR